MGKFGAKIINKRLGCDTWDKSRKNIYHLLRDKTWFCGVIDPYSFICKNCGYEVTKIEKTSIKLINFNVR